MRAPGSSSARLLRVACTFPTRRQRGLQPYGAAIGEGGDGELGAGNIGNIGAGGVGAGEIGEIGVGETGEIGIGGVGAGAIGNIGVVEFGVGTLANAEFADNTVGVGGAGVDVTLNAAVGPEGNNWFCTTKLPVSEAGTVQFAVRVKDCPGWRTSFTTYCGSTPSFDCQMTLPFWVMTNPSMLGPIGTVSI